MSDRTAVQLYVYSCPPEQTWAIAQVIEEYQLLDNCAGSYRTGEPFAERVGLSAWDLGYVEPGDDYLGTEIPCGSATEIADFLIHNAPNASWDVWEDPKYEWLGQRYIYSPELGLWSQKCSTQGTVLFTADEVAGWVKRARSGADLDELAREFGRPWLDLKVADRRIVPIGPRPDGISDAADGSDWS